MSEQTAADRRERYAAAIRQAGDTAYGNRPFYESITDAVMAVADDEQAELRRERDLAIAHDRQPYPTAWAYEQACKARTKHQERADVAETAVARVRQLHDRLAEETDLHGPEDLLTRGSAARRIARALDGWNPTGAPQCSVEFENGARCAKPAGHRPPGSDDPHVPALDADQRTHPAP